MNTQKVLFKISWNSVIRICQHLMSNRKTIDAFLIILMVTEISIWLLYITLKYKWYKMFISYETKYWYLVNNIFIKMTILIIVTFLFFYVWWTISFQFCECLQSYKQFRIKCNRFFEIYSLIFLDFFKLFISILHNLFCYYISAFIVKFF